MPDRWEDYFDRNRAEMERFEPDEERIWQTIDKELNRRSVKWKKHLFKVAMVAAIVLVAGVIMRHELMMREQLSSLAAINEELAERELQYINQVKMKWDELRSMPSNDIELDLMLMGELELLDTIYIKGLNDLKQHGYNERAILIMLDTYEKRLRIIERLINEKRKKQRDENKSEHVRI